MKKFNLGLSVGLLIGFLVFTGVALADGIIKVNLLVNGQKHNAEVIMANNKTYVPLRQFSELIGYKVDWDQKTNTISLSNDGNRNSNVSVGNEDENKNYTIDKTSEHTIVMFNDGFRMVLTGNKENNKVLNKFFYVTLFNNSAQNINTDSDYFKYVDSIGTITRTKSFVGNSSYLKNIELYPKTNNGGLILFETLIDIDYLIYDDGVHYAEIHDIATSDLTDIVNLFYRIYYNF